MIDDPAHTRLAHPRLRAPGPATPVLAPAPVIHHRAAREVLDGVTLWELYSQASWAEGPVWWPQHNTLVFSDVVGRRVLGWRTDGTVDVLIDATPFINGNAVDRDGRLVHCEHGRRAISRSTSDGTLEIIATHAADIRLNAPNDIAVADDGSIWFTDPTFGLTNPQQGAPGTASGVTSVCAIGSDGRVQRLTNVTEPNGLGFSPDGATFYVSQTPEDEPDQVVILAFDRNGDTLTNPRRFATVAHGIPDGFTIDHRGWVWSSSATAIEIFDPAGTHLATIPTPHLCSNCCFNPTYNQLFITGENALWRLDLTPPKQPRTDH